MSKTIEDLRFLASKIEEAEQQGENTKLRVGGLFQDIIDFVGVTIPEAQITLGPFLEALNNSTALNDNVPENGVVLSFINNKWDFSGEVSQLRLELGRLSSTVTTDYDSFTAIQNSFRNTLQRLDSRLSEDETEYGSYIEESSQHIATMVAALTVDGQIKSMSSMVQTANEIQTQVTTNKEASEKVLNALFGTEDKTFDDEDPEWYESSWIVQSKNGIFGAVATFDEEGNILASSKLHETVDTIETEITDLEGNYSRIVETVSGIESRVGTVEGNYSQILQMYDRIDLKVEGIDGTVAQMGVTLNSKVDANGVRQLISEAYISADKISLTSSFLSMIADSIDVSASDINWTFESAVTWYAKWGNFNKPVMQLDANGNLTLMGQLATNSEIVSGSGVTAGDLVSVFGSMVNGFRAHTICISGATTYLNFSDGAVQAITRVTYESTKTVYLPTLSDFRSVLHKSSGEDFSCQLTIINQAEITSNTYDKDDVWVKGGTHNYADSITSGSSRPRIMRGDVSAPYDVQVPTRNTGIFFITYINSKFIANYILG